MSGNEQGGTPPVRVLAALIDHWWFAADQPTTTHDGVEYVASLALARFLIANGISVPSASEGERA